VGAHIRQSKSRAALIAAIPASITSVFLAWLISSGKWDVFGIWKLDSVIGWQTGFGDLAFITASADCFATGTVDLNSCDPYGRPYSPYGLIPGTLLSWFTLGLEHTGVLGTALAGIWVITVFGLVYRISRTWTLSQGELFGVVTMVSLFAISPTVLLAVERGSLDILVTSLTLLGLLGFTRNERLIQILSAASLFLAVALKYFAVGVFAPFFAPRKWSLVGLLGATATALFMALNWSNLQQASEIAGTGGLSTSRLSYSNTTGLVTILVEDPLAYQAPDDSSLSGFTLRIISFLLLCLIVLGFWLLLRGSFTSFESSAPQASWLLIVGGTFALLIPYLIGSSYDYRLVLLIVPLAGFAQWLTNTENRPLRITLWLMITLTVIVALTGASMQPNEFGFILPKALIIFGDAALATVLAFGVALFLHAWIPRKRVNT